MTIQDMLFTSRAIHNVMERVRQEALDNDTMDVYFETNGIEGFQFQDTEGYQSDVLGTFIWPKDGEAGFTRIMKGNSQAIVQYPNQNYKYKPDEDSIESRFNGKGINPYLNYESFSIGEDTQIFPLKK